MNLRKRGIQRRVPLPILTALSLVAMLVSTAAAEVVPFSSERWTIDAEEAIIEEHDGKESLFLRSGRASLGGVSFENGSIEFDIQFSARRGFMGGFWRMSDPGNREEFYMRPHQSGQVDANQYTPVFNGNSGWQLYHGPGYGAAINYPYNQWIHVRIVYAGNLANIYINSGKPTLTVSELKHAPVSGGVGVMANFAPAYFANFEYQEMEGINLKGTADKAETAPVGTVMEWGVSSVFPESDLEGVTQLDADKIADLSWSSLTSEATGITNLSRVQAFSQQANSTFARIVIRSEGTTSVPFSLGYSDKARVYLNGTLLYSGTNFYQSRDYRYLGTIGLFDQVYLPLQPGDNELMIAVSEAFGGWGILGQLPENEGLSWTP